MNSSMYNKLTLSDGAPKLMEYKQMQVVGPAAEKFPPASFNILKEPLLV